jgi:hypothetical protein
VGLIEMSVRVSYPKIAIVTPSDDDRTFVVTNTEIDELPGVGLRFCPEPYVGELFRICAKIIQAGRHRFKGLRCSYEGLWIKVVKAPASHASDVSRPR